MVLEVNYMLIGFLTANMMKLGITCDGSDLDYASSDGVPQVLVLEMKSPSNLEPSLSTYIARDLWLTTIPLRLAVRLQKASCGLYGYVF